MGLNSIFSDYGSGSSSESYSPWGCQDTWEVFQSRLQDTSSQNMPRSSSFTDITSPTHLLDAKMQEFRMNGKDSPYNPDDDRIASDCRYSGMGPSSGYLRQKSWPAPEKTPTEAIPPLAVGRSADYTLRKPSAAEIILSVRPSEVVEDREPYVTPALAAVTDQQMRVLSSLPNNVLYSLLREMEEIRGRNTRKRLLDMVCRFCKNNGERESYYRSHVLRENGRVNCPVLRAFVCQRCGATGDRAHTLKYCPLATAAERKKCTAMMQSVRMASGRRRPRAPAAHCTGDYVVFGDTSPSLLQDGAVYNSYESAPLDPIWEALEKKLML